MEIALIIQIIEALAALAPKIPELIAAVEAVISSLRSGTPLTPEQQVAVDALLARAHSEFQAPLASTVASATANDPPPASAGMPVDATATAPKGA